MSSTELTTPIGANTWIWESPITDAALAELVPRLSAWGFDLVELPIQNLGDWNPERTAELLAANGLSASICIAMAPGRELCGTDAQTVRKRRTSCATASTPQRRSGRKSSPGPSTRPSAARGGCRPRSETRSTRSSPRRSRHSPNMGRNATCDSPWSRSSGTRRASSTRSPKPSRSSTGCRPKARVCSWTTTTRTSRRRTLRTPTGWPGPTRARAPLRQRSRRTGQRPLRLAEHRKCPTRDRVSRRCRHRVLHRRERGDRHGGFDLATDGGVSRPSPSTVWPTLAGVRLIGQARTTAGAVLPRTTSSGVIAGPTRESSTWRITSISSCMLRWPNSSKSWRTVVSGGVR